MNDKPYTISCYSKGSKTPNKQVACREWKYAKERALELLGTELCDCVQVTDEKLELLLEATLTIHRLPKKGDVSRPLEVDYER